MVWQWQLQSASHPRLWAWRVLLRACVLSAVLSVAAQAQTYYIGVLAPQGEAAAQRRWQPWLDTLNAQSQDDTLVLVPLALENWQEQIKAEQFALVLGPQVQFVKMQTTGWRWLATLQSQVPPKSRAEFTMSAVSRSDFETAAQFALYQQLERTLAKNNADKVAYKTSATEQIASALWVAADSDIEQLRDLRGRKIVAVDPDAFGGYLLIAHLLQTNRLSPLDYDTQFVGYPIELTLSTLASGAVDAAIAPLCLMEEMTAAGKIDQARFRLIHPMTTDSSCQSSTAIYPNWTLAATKQAPAQLIERINQQLFGTPAMMATDNGFRWLPPESNVDAARVLYEMRQHPAQQPLSAYIMDWIKSHRLWVSVIVLIVLISAINYGWMSWLAWRRRQQIMTQNALIRNYDAQLRQSERLAVMGEMSGAIAHEVNQPLATIQNYAQGLLLRSQNARTTKDSTEYALQKIVDETERTAAIITNIRRWAKQTPSAEVVVDIAHIYQQSLLFMGDKACDISFWFGSDYQQLRLPNLVLDQFLINALLNAQQQGAKRIMVRCQMDTFAGDNWLAVRISDDAGGFEAAQLSGTLNTVQSDKPHGLGFGLMICQRLCKSVGGKMTLSNIAVADELIALKKSKRHYPLRQKHAPSTQSQWMGGEPDDSDQHQTGAQLTLYLPMQVAFEPHNTNERHQ